MKSEWQWKPLGDVCDVVNGGTPKTGVSKYWHGSHLWITPAEMGGRSSPYVNDTERKITDLGLRDSSARMLPPNSVILSSRAPIGHLVINTKSMATNQGCKGLIPGEQLDSKFLYYYLSSTVELLNSLGTGATFKELSGGKLKEVPVPVAPLSEQQRIVTILDSAFDGIAAAKGNAERNLNKARALFESHLQSLFTQPGVGHTRKRLGDLATFRNGINFTRSSRGQSVKIVGVKDFQQNFWAPVDNLDTVIIDGSLPDLDALNENDILFVRSNGNLELIGRCILVGPVGKKTTHSGFTIRARLTGTGVVPKYLCHFLKSNTARRTMIDSGIGTNIKSLNQATLSALDIPVPSTSEQIRVAASIESFAVETRRLESIFKKKLDALDALKRSLLHQAFTGQLTGRNWLTELPGISTTDLHAGILAMAHDLHEQEGRLEFFGHVKAEKIAHMVETRLGISLGRKPVKDAAGPNDFHHLKIVESRARKANFFDFKQTREGAYKVHKLRGFDQLIGKARNALGGRLGEVENLLKWMLPMNTQQAEIATTVFAAWNNLLLDGKQPTDEDIVLEARENWHPNKLKIERERFFIAVHWLREKGLVPEGKGQRVSTKAN